MVHTTEKRQPRLLTVLAADGFKKPFFKTFHLEMESHFIFWSLNASFLMTLKMEMNSLAFSSLSAKLQMLNERMQ